MCGCRSVVRRVFHRRSIPAVSYPTEMTHYGVITNNRDCEIWKIKGLQDSLSRHDRVDKFGLVFEVGVRVAVAQLFGCEHFERRLVLCEYRLAQRFDRLFDCPLILGSGHRGDDQGCCAEREHAATAKLRRVKFMAILPL